MSIMSSKTHFAFFEQRLSSRTPFVFVRFSDGEIEVLKNNSLKIGAEGVSWSKGTSQHVYPNFDFKTFEPDLHQMFRQDLMNSATQRAKNYFKGTPARHNRALGDRDWLVSLNGETLENLTFADVFLNSNFLKFRKRIIPLFKNFPEVYVLGNFRMQPELVNSSWKHITIPDDFIADYENVLSSVMDAVCNVKKDSLVLASASSLTNIVGSKIVFSRPDLTYIDIGTSMHDLMGMGGNVREYHSLLLPWTLRSFKSKLGYYLSGSHKIRW